MVSPRVPILCTEDDIDTRDLIVLVLQQNGFDVTCTGDANDALSLAKSEVFDLYLIDSWLPGESGISLTRKIREFDGETPILFYSGAARDVDKDAAANAGAQGYLVKPADADHLIAEINRLLLGAN